MSLWFHAYDTNGIDHSFNYITPQTVIVDNTPPVTPSFTTSVTSTTVFVSAWQTTDFMSGIYTDHNSSSGLNGIKDYTVTLKNMSNHRIQNNRSK